MARVTIDYTPAVYQQAGVGRSIRQLVDALSLLDSPHTYTLFTQGRGSLPRPDFDSTQFKWRSSPLSPEWHARLWHRLRLPVPVELWSGRSELFFASDFVLPPTLTSATLLFIHDLSFVRVSEAAAPPLKRYLDQAVPESVRRAKRILVNSAATAQDVMDIYGVSPERISQITFGVEPRFFDAVLLTDAQRVSLGLSERPYILAVGTVQPRKNYERLFEAFALLVQDGLEADLAIVGGRGWLETPIFERVKSLGLSDRVRWLGFVDDLMLPSVYASAELLCFVSLYEGFGLPILEAMAAGTPVVTSNLSSMPEAAGGAALLADPYDVSAIADGMRQLLTDSDLRRTLVERGRVHAQQATWARSARQLLDAFELTLR